MPTIDEIKQDMSPEERLWTRVLSQAKEDLLEGRRMAAGPMSTVRETWRLIRAVTLYESARLFFEAEDGAQYLCELMECDYDVFLNNLGRTNLELVAPSAYLGAAFKRLDALTPGWVHKRHELSDAQLESLERVREFFPVLARVRGLV